jgi:hypothetical protein
MFFRANRPQFTLFLTVLAIGSLLVLTTPVVHADIGIKATSVGPVVIEHESGFTSGAWKIERAWDRAAELEFAAFMKQFGEEREKRGFTFAQGVKNPKVNLLWTEDDKDFEVKVDCATFPYLIRAYFAYKTRRPFMWHSNKGRRYGKENKPRLYSDFSMFTELSEFFSALDSSLSSAHFRMNALLEGTDTYPVDVTKESVIPGTVYYDPNGHVMIAYKVDEYDGDMYFLDSHPDGTMTIRQFGKRYAIGSSALGGGFRVWRHDRVEVIDEETGAFRIIRQSNSESDFYSADAQYKWDYEVDGFKLNYWEWVRSKVSRNGVYAYPIEDFDLLLDTVCEEVQARVSAVRGGMTAGMHLKAQPAQLPFNIYGASGEWEEYATPGRDVRVRAAFTEAYVYVLKTMELAAEGSGRLKYALEPWDLYREFQRIWEEHQHNKICQFDYENSNGESVSLTLDDIMERLFDLSFDPYHCPELRWGAGPKSESKKARAEFDSCPENSRKLFWFNEESRLRNRTTRLVTRGTATHRGPSGRPDINIPELLKCYQDNVPVWDKCHHARRRFLRNIQPTPDR